MRRAWLPGIDLHTRADQKERKQAVEARVRQLGGIFAIGIYTPTVIRKPIALHARGRTRSRRALVGRRRGRTLVAHGVIAVSPVHLLVLGWPRYLTALRLQVVRGGAIPLA